MISMGHWICVNALFGLLHSAHTHLRRYHYMCRTEEQCHQVRCCHSLRFLRIIQIWLTVRLLFAQLDAPPASHDLALKGKKTSAVHWHSQETQWTWFKMASYGLCVSRDDSLMLTKYWHSSIRKQIMLNYIRFCGHTRGVAVWLAAQCAMPISSLSLELTSSRHCLEFYFAYILNMWFLC